MAFKYEGALSKSIPAPQLGLLSDEKQIADAAQAIADNKTHKMSLLFEAHGVEAGNWVALCFALAESHVPGFRLKSKTGPKTKWDDFRRAELVLAVEEYGQSITEATKHLADIQPWKALVTHTRGSETLRDEYTRADPRWVRVLRDARNYQAINDAQVDSQNGD